MPRVNRPRHAQTHDWQKIKQCTLWPEQHLCEKLRTVVLFNERAAERASETGDADLFAAQGLISLLPKGSVPPSDDARGLSSDRRQCIIDLKAEHPGFRSSDIAPLCFGRRPPHHTIQRVPASGPRPSITARRFPPYGEIADSSERCCIVVRLRAEGWSVLTISTSMQTTRATIDDILQRWAKKGREGLKDTSYAPHESAWEVTFEDIQEVRRQARNSEIDAYHEMATLEQIGSKLSQRTCGRLLQRNRSLYGLEKPKHLPQAKQEKPFKAHFRHRFWSVGVRSIKKHQIYDYKGPIYLISILENDSRAVLANKVSPMQNPWNFLEVLFAAFSAAGLTAVVSDGGGTLSSNQVMNVYQDLGIQKERIDPKQVWRSYREINIIRRMTDFHFHHAKSWEAVQQIPRKWVQDYNSQRPRAHKSRDDGCHSPGEVIGWPKGTMVPEKTLKRMLFATCYTRHLDRYGYLRLQDWRLYGEHGLACQPVNVWVYEGTLKREHQVVALSKYRVESLADRRHIKAVSNPRSAETIFRSLQMTLFNLGLAAWLWQWKAPSYASRRRRKPASKIRQRALCDEARSAKRRRTRLNETSSLIPRR